MPPREAVLFVPGSLETPTGGYEYDRRIVQGLRNQGWRVDVRELDATFPQPTGAARTAARQALASVSDGQIVIVDGLALGALPDEANRERDRLRLVALVHHPLARETGLSSDMAAALETSERQALAAAQAVVVTSKATANTLEASYGVSRERLAVVEPGTDRAPVARGSGGPDVHMICVATITPRKGHLVLIDALARLTDDNWRLTCAGSTDRDPETFDAVRNRLAAHGLESRVQFTGSLDRGRLAKEYDRADLFVLPTFYEGYGMAVAEALAHGLPVVSTPTGGIEGLVHPHAGLLVEAGDVAALADALARVLRDASFRQTLVAGARQVRERLPDWDDAAAKMEKVLDAVLQ